MRTRVEFVESSLNEVHPLRADYLDTLAEPQELLLEVMIAEAKCFRIMRRGELCGYLVVGAEQTLLEFYLIPSLWVFGEQVFGHALTVLQIHRAIVKSYDSLLFSSAVGYKVESSVLGLLVRDYIPRPLPVLPNMEFEARKATEADGPAVLAVEQNVFTRADRIWEVIRGQQMMLFEREGNLLGFGIIRPVVPDRPDVDVSIAVDKPFLRRGVATYILRWLVEYSRGQGWNPIAGCSISNTVSRHTGERIGFVARHRMLELRFQ